MKSIFYKVVKKMVLAGNKIWSKFSKKSKPFSRVRGLVRWWNIHCQVCPSNFTLLNSKPTLLGIELTTLEHTKFIQPEDCRYRHVVQPRFFLFIFYNSRIIIYISSEPDLELDSSYVRNWSWDFWEKKLELEVN